jgi:hypothetical protein
VLRSSKAGVASTTRTQKTRSCRSICSDVYARVDVLLQIAWIMPAALREELLKFNLPEQLAVSDN